jgi:hypothetical protein
VQPVPFLYPLAHRVRERPYVGTGVFLDETLAASAPEPQRMARHLLIVSLNQQILYLSHSNKTE